jgi:transcriptional regulator with XRE-family HTH domain
MPKGKLTNYIRVYRRRAGLRQQDLASLLGFKGRGPISDIENRRRTPCLRTALALATVFGVPVEELFPGMREGIASEAKVRLRKLASALGSKVGKKERCGYRTARKLQWLMARCGSAAIDVRSTETHPRA